MRDVLVRVRLFIAFFFALYGFAMLIKSHDDQQVLLGAALCAVGLSALWYAHRAG